MTFAERAPREFEKEHFKLAQLSPLGRRLPGLDRC